MLDEFEKSLGYIFKNKELLKTALTHSSFSNEMKGKVKDYERLEFLGDSVLGFVISEYIFQKFQNLPEGKLTKLRASLVCEKSLHNFSKKINVGKFLRLSRGEEHSGGKTRPSILADVFESLVAAVFLDGGLEETKKFILKHIIKNLNELKNENFVDYKTELQEIIQKNPEEMIEYALVREEGPDHNKNFTVELRINSNVIGSGSGRSKKDAEQMAAKEALILMGY